MAAIFQWLGQAALSYDDKLAQARAWDRDFGPGWFVVDRIEPSTVREVVRITVRDPETRALIVQRDLEQRPLAVAETRGFWTSWAVDQVLHWRRPGDVRTECPAGAVRWKNPDTNRDECFSCAPPLVMRVGADGRPYCRGRPRLREAAPRPPPVFRYSAPRAFSALRGVSFEWLGQLQCAPGELFHVYPELGNLETCTQGCLGGSVATQVTATTIACACPAGQEMQLHAGEPRCTAPGASCPAELSQGTSSTTGVRTCSKPEPSQVAPGSRPNSSGGAILAALVILGVAVAIFAATVRGTRVGVML